MYKVPEYIMKEKEILGYNGTIFWERWLVEGDEAE